MNLLLFLNYTICQLFYIIILNTDFVNSGTDFFRAKSSWVPDDKYTIGIDFNTKNMEFI